MEFTGSIKELNIDYINGTGLVTLTLNKSNLNALNNLKEEKLKIKVTKYRKSRSLDANAYFWVLAEKVAEKLEITGVEVYKDLIKNIGQHEILPIKDEALETFTKAWQHNGTGWICKSLGKSKIEGYTNVKAYYGSSVYDTKAMSRLIDLIVQECQQLRNRN